VVDNVVLNAGSGGSTVATDDVAGIHYQLVKLAFGALDTATLVTGTTGLPVGDAGGSLTVDGTVTANAGTGTFSVGGLAAHDAPVSGNPHLTAGRASAAAPVDVTLDGDAADLWVLRSGALATVVTAAGALVGGDAANGLDVDVTRIIPGTTATALGKAEDAAHATADTGVMALAVRNDAGSVLAGTTGDYIPFTTTATGALITGEQGSGSFATGQVSITTTATSIAAARTTRRAIMVINHGTTEVFLGASGVTTTTGIKLENVDGASISLPIVGALFGIVAAGTQTVSFIEVFD
jgi:hypothetical protein